MLPSEYEAVYEQILADVAESYRHRSQSLTGFWPVVGRQFQPTKGLMVVGRAVNGWGDGWTAEEVADQRTRREEIDKLKAPAPRDGTCPMDWLQESQEGWTASRSAFFRVTRCVLAALSPAQASVPSIWSELCFSNLCKIAPAEGGNPNNGLWRIQLNGCAELLRLELLTWRPKYVLVIAGRDWSQPFVERLGGEFDWSGTDHVVTRGELDGSRWVITNRPECRPEAAFVGQVLDAFGIDHPERSTWNNLRNALTANERTSRLTAVFAPRDGGFSAHCVEVPVGGVEAKTRNECRELLVQKVQQRLTAMKSEVLLEMGETASSEMIDVFVDDESPTS